MGMWINDRSDRSLGLGETDGGETSLTPGLRTESARVGRPVRLTPLVALAVLLRPRTVAAGGSLSRIDEG